MCKKLNFRYELSFSIVVFKVLKLCALQNVNILKVDYKFLKLTSGECSSTNCLNTDLMSLIKTNRQNESRPFAVHLCAEVDLEVLCVVKDVEEGTALVKLGNAEERKKSHHQWSSNITIHSRKTGK